MNSNPPPTMIIRHRLENLKKCSLRGLENRSDCLFITYPYAILPPIDQYIVLSMDAPVLSPNDAEHGILLIDATWRYAAKMLKPLENRPELLYRSLPGHYRTAYPRCQHDCPDPYRGLASIEALYLSYLILERNTEGLLDQYYWKNQFISLNKI
jgi:pre-rRNA-processing protein TSR3